VNDDPAASADPVLVRVRRGGYLESVHRGAFAVADADGRLVHSVGNTRSPVFARSAIKALQALPLVESGAADRFGFEPPDLALAISSHNAEAQHTERAAAILERLGLGPEHLRCGAQAPGDPAARRALAASGAAPGAIHNNCSGKHAGFLALGAHLAADPECYLDHGGAVQSLVRGALAAMCGLDPDAIEHAIDGCSAPTYRLPLAAMASAFARLADPSSLAPERARAAGRLLDAAAAHPALVAGEHQRLDTALLRATGGRLFCKVGAEAVYVVAERDSGLGLAIKVDDGGYRGLFPLVVGVCRELGWLDARAVEALSDYAPGALRNWAGLDVGSVEVDALAASVQP
jgi:L-asparaginase II